jgi:ribosomal protein S18 acetylase RimI-like enzyme
MPDNTPARTLYQSLGFQEARRPVAEPTSHPSIVYMEHAAQQGVEPDVK